ncbi:S-adenosyl-L-methionine-dependentmethyltransferases superfamily protein [Striga asiatica]|uniref:S-adenosyl-L-methionine-dependentmethyltransferases superfamily protein n=1 Tax=Striga asiatica TaxID=4170 RepID=A0A5A7R3Q8_STRAF|nr:S-adenosyl-L-methionine-dependentmethyltransferases superfamily protein [Striga asiatica]
MAQVSPMTGGDDTNSYVKNSTFQRDGLNAAQEAIKEALTETLDLKTLLLGSTTFNIADLGCAAGPNTLLAIQAIIEIIRHMNRSQGALEPDKLEFKALLNDLPANDFNTLFSTLPKLESCYVAGVPGSFYGRLFPRSSVHVAYTSSSLHWLSGPPSELRERGGPAWNPGRIHYTWSDDEAVVRAYERQYEEDMGVFLKARGDEVAAGGAVVIIMPGVADRRTPHDVGIAITFLGSILMDMVNEGLLDHDLVDTFNFPHMYPWVEQMTRLVEKNGCFDVVKIELRNARPDLKARIDMESAIRHLRAFTQGSIGAHFGSEIVHQLFERAFNRKTDLAQMLLSSGIEIGAQLFAVLKRK